MRENNVLTQIQIAERWKMTKQQVFRMRQNKDFPAPTGKIGRSVFYSIDDIKNYEMKNKRLKEKLNK